MLLVKEVVVHASARKMEWIMAGLYIHLAYVLALPSDTFGQSESFRVLEYYTNESGWAWIFGIFGLIRLIVLFLNGTHIKQSAEARMILAGISFIIICLWVWGIDAAMIVSTEGATYKWLALGELLNVWQASSDRRARRELHKNGKR